ncbi:4-hydroxybutyrate coenzyme A transferase, partial [Trichinella britovi]
LGILYCFQLVRHLRLFNMAALFFRTIVNSCFKFATPRLFSSVVCEPFQPISGRTPKICSPEEAVRHVKSGDSVYTHGVAGTPTLLIDALADYAKSAGLTGVKLYHIHLEGPAKWAEPEYCKHIRSQCLFIAGNLRQAVNEGRADCLSIFLSDTPALFHRGVVKVDVAIVTVSPPDKKGFCTLGTGVDCTRAALQHAKFIIGIANPNMPRTFGDGCIHMSHFDCLVNSDRPLYNSHQSKMSAAEEQIGKLIAENLIEDGSTLQMGIGNIPDAVLLQLKGHKDLGIHTEMFSDGVLALIENGALTNSKKRLHPGKLVSSFSLGSKQLYDWMNDNPMLYMGDVTWVNDPAMIKLNPKVCAINSGIEVDLTGQIVADSIGTRIYSGFGGQVDFMRGAAIGIDGKGKPIMALQSVTKKGESKIVPVPKLGAGVVTTRAHAHYVVTENGIANLFGKNMRQRAYEMIRIANVNHRQSLEKSFYDRFKCMPSSD